MQFLVPKHAKVFSGRDADYSYISVRFTSQGRRFYLKSQAGPFIARAVAFEDLRKESVSYSERALESEDGSNLGLDTRGILQNGTRWRWVGPTVGEEASYEGAAEDAAQFFDSILDSACIGNDGG